ncbi:PQQ-binding-like beta-propeller repeat protein [Streptomyces sp. NPDC020362]|uniref:caspase, EACC1-associated type n=1 Tax=unclassified Streptomyces TaxID=2593676 RepID=UPI00340E41C3
MTDDASPLSDPNSSRVLLVGTSTYQSGKLEDLPAVRNNVEALRDALTEGLWRLPAANCVTLLDPPDAATVIDELNHAAGARDTVVFYYAGHGLIDVRGDKAQLLLTLPTSSEDEPHRCLAFTDVRDALTRVRARRRVVILDCCFAGRADSLGDSGSLGRSRDVAGSYLLCACGPTHKAQAPKGATYTGFTRALLELLDRGVAGAGPVLDMNTVFEWLVRELGAVGLPAPHQSNTALGGRIAFIVNRAEVAPGTPPSSLLPSRRRPVLTRRRALITVAGLAAAGAGAGFVLRDFAAAGDGGVSRPGEQRWRHHFSATALVLAGDRIVFGLLQDGRVVGLRPADGELQWEADLRGSLNRSSVVKGLALVSLADTQEHGVLAAVDGDGRKRWTLRTNGWPWYQTEGPNDEIYAVTSAGWIHRVDLDTGKSDYAQKISGQLNEVAAADNQLYVSTYRDGLIALDAAKGTPSWTHPTKGFVPGAAVDSRQVYLTVGHGTDRSSFGGQLVALDARKGQVRWSHTFDSLIQVGPTLAAGRVLVTDGRGTLHAFSATDGQRTWQQDVSGDLSSRVTHDGETVYAGTTQGVTALSLNTGEIQWVTQVVADPPTTEYSSAQPVIDAHTVYLAYSDRTTSGTNCDIFAFSR